MRTGIAKKTYNVLALNDDGDIVEGSCFESLSVEIDQHKGDDLEVWQERNDGFLFVYCNRMEIGYWVLPSLITIKAEV
jgi:transketolase N-terminal domain/subunit